MISALETWVGNGWLRRHEASPEEVANLNAIVARELKDSAIQGLSFDARMGMLYNAALKLADIALRVRGYRASGERHHYRVITSLAHTLGSQWSEAMRFLETIQKLRHRADYESVGLATQSGIKELRSTVAELQEAVAELVDDWGQ